MTVAAFLLECETCHDKIGLMTGAVEQFICLSCAADKAFGSGKDGSTKAVAAAETAPVPANPVGVAAHIPPAPTGTSLPPERTYFGCPGIGELGDEFYVASHSAVWHFPGQRGLWPNALCESCYASGQRRKKAVGSR